MEVGRTRRSEAETADYGARCVPTFACLPSQKRITVFRTFKKWATEWMFDTMTACKKWGYQKCYVIENHRRNAKTAKWMFTWRRVQIRSNQSQFKEQPNMRLTAMHRPCCRAKCNLKGLFPEITEKRRFARYAHSARTPYVFFRCHTYLMEQIVTRNLNTAGTSFLPQLNAEMRRF
jgi:hypothetical protein